jgi:hypothetical protein
LHFFLLPNFLGSLPHLRHDEAEGAAGRVGNKKPTPKDPPKKNPKKPPKNTLKMFSFNF